MTGTLIKSKQVLFAGVAEWQTQRTQNPPTARSWGFKSLPRHFHCALLARNENAPERASCPIGLSMPGQSGV